jgi:hypothetical protein
MTTYIGFTGHRNVLCNKSFLDMVVEQHDEDVVWVHGGAIGFDTQVDQYAKEHNILVEKILPDYVMYGRMAAPHVRNRRIVDMCSELIACYDGREGGGTRSTIDYAVGRNKKVTIFKPSRYIKT